MYRNTKSNRDSGTGTTETIEQKGFLPINTLLEKQNKGNLLPELVVYRKETKVRIGLHQGRVIKQGF